MLPAINRFGAFARLLQALLGLVLFAFYVREAVLHRWQFLFTMVLHCTLKYMTAYSLLPNSHRGDWCVRTHTAFGLLDHADILAHYYGSPRCGGVQVESTRPCGAAPLHTVAPL